MEQPDIFEFKSYLFTIAYNMVGDVAAAEDLVQDTFEQWLRTEPEEVRQVKPYLSRILINKAIDKLKKLNKEREAYKGLWMPQPLLTEDGMEDENTLEYAVLFLLEKLNPYERAVFVLKEVFSFAHQEIATALNITIDSCRQLLHRAKEKVRTPGKQKQAEIRKQQELLEAFLLAVYQKNFDKLHEIFINDIVMYQDGGGKVAAALKPISGFSKIIKFLEGVMNLEPEAVFDIKPVQMNGERGIIIFRNGLLDSVLSIEIEQEKISKLFFIRNPDKIVLKKAADNNELVP
jgi:RNA polymerase sigma-70 factor (ECF subfamily)